MNRSESTSAKDLIILVLGIATWVLAAYVSLWFLLIMPVTVIAFGAIRVLYSGLRYAHSHRQVS